MSRLWSVTDTTCINLLLYNSFVTSVCHCAPLYWKWVFEFLSSKRSTRNQVDFNSNRISMSTARLVYYYLFFNSLAFHLTILLHFSFVFYPFSRICHVHSATGRWYFSAHLQRWFYDFKLERYLLCNQPIIDTCIWIKTNIIKIPTCKQLLL